MKPRPLSGRELRFVEQYLIDLNATKAAARAGYSKKTSRQIGARLLSRVVIAERISQEQQARATRVGITAERVLAELEELAFSDVTHYDMDPQTGRVELVADAPKKAMRAVASVKHRKIPYGDGDFIHEVELKLWSKPDALKLAGKHVDVHGFVDRMELTGKNGKPLFRDTKDMTLAEEVAELEALVAKVKAVQA